MNDFITNLSRGLTAKDPEIRIATAKKLGAAVKSTEDKIDVTLALLKILPDSDPFVNSAAERAIVALGDNSILEMVAYAEKDPRIQKHLERVLYKLQPSHIYELALKEADLERKAGLIRNTPAFSPAILPELSKLLESGNEQLVSAAADCLARFENAAKDISPVLLELPAKLKSEDAIASVIMAAGSTGEPSESAQAALIPLTKSKTQKIRRAAIFALRRLGRLTEKYWLGLLTDKDEQVQDYAILALMHMKGLSKAAYARIAAYVQTPSAPARRTAVPLLFSEPEMSEPVLNCILGILENDADLYLRRLTMRFCARTTNQRVLDKLLQLITSSNRDIQFLAIDIAVKKFPVVDILAQVLKNSDAVSRILMFIRMYVYFRFKDKNKLKLFLKEGIKCPDLRISEKAKGYLRDNDYDSGIELSLAGKIIAQIRQNAGWVNGEIFSAIEKEKRFFAPLLIQLLRENLSRDEKERIVVFLVKLFPSVKKMVAYSKILLEKDIVKVKEMHMESLIEVVEKHLTPEK